MSVAVVGRTEAGDLAAPPPVPGSPGRPPGLATRLLRRPTFTLSTALVASWVAAALVGSWLQPHDPGRQHPSDRLRPPGGDWWLGTDSYGRDVLSRVLAGARPVLAIAPLAVAVALVAGTAIGLAVGYRRGLVDGVVMRTFDTLEVLPSLLPIILLVALLGRSTTVLVGVIAAVFVPIVTRTVRGAVLVEREKGYVEAARMRGERAWFVTTREILPNITGPIAVEATVRLADAAFSIATLSFLGLGAEVGSPDWGAQVADNRTYLQTAWWTVLFPSLAIASLVVAVSLAADIIGEELDR